MTQGKRQVSASAKRRACENAPKSVAEQIAIGQVRNAGGDGPEQQSLPAAKEIADEQCRLNPVGQV